MADRDEQPGFISRLFGGRGARAQANVAAAPTSQKSFAVDSGSSFWVVPDDEKVPELKWPYNLDVYDEMRRQDAQVISVLRAVMLPIRRTTWRIDPAGASDDVVEFVAANLGLPIKGREPKPQPRTRDRFSWSEHLGLALTSLIFGHSFFEQQYRIERDAFGQPKAYIRKLAWIPPRTISKIDVAADGGLKSIQQGGLVLGAGGEDIDISQLVVYVNDREGGNWLGQSLLRPAYKYWKLKDLLLRVQVQTIERNGMGVPVVTAPEIPEGLLDPADYQKLQDEQIAAGLKIAKGFRSGRTAGASVAHGGQIQLLGVEGQLPDAEKPIRYMDEQIARAVLAHFLNLGTETGSWALGSTFADFFTLSLQTVALSIADTATQHIVEDLVDLNFGEDVPAPRITFDEIGSQQIVTHEAIKSLIDSGALSPDPELERFLRQRYTLPEMQGGQAAQAAPGATAAAPSAADVKAARAQAEIVQKVYLGIGPVMSRAEGRRLLRKAGIELDDDDAEPEVAPEPEQPTEEP
jgi:hypothetical protein